MPTIKQRLTVNLPDDEYAELAALAEKNHLTMAWIGRKAISDFLERYRDRQIPLTFAANAKSPEWLEHNEP